MPKSGKQVLLDTSILLLPGMELKDIFTPIEQEYEILIPEACIKELRAMTQSQDKRGRSAKLALILIEQKNLKIISSTQLQRADDELLRIAKQLKIPIITLDKELKKRAKQQGIQIKIIKKNNIVEG